MTRKPWLPMALTLPTVTTTAVVDLGLPDIPIPKPRSQRRRLWELSAGAPCPVLGSCLNMPQLQAMMTKAGLDTRQRTVYELHVMAVSECRQRTPLAEGVNKALDRRFSLEIAAARMIKGENALEGHWQAAQQSPGWVGPLWATLTHPDCTGTLEHRILGGVHMLQHQVGMTSRLNQHAHDELKIELQRTRSVLLHVQQQLAAEQRAGSQKVVQLEGEIREAGLHVTRETAVRERVEAEWASFRQAQVELDDRSALAARNQQLEAQVAELQQALKHLRRERAPARQSGGDCVAVARTAERPRATALPSVPLLQSAQHCSTCTTPLQNPCRVVCVGGRATHVPGFKAVVESRGGTFLHHDGGEQDSIQPASRAKSVSLAPEAVAGLFSFWALGHSPLSGLQYLCKQPCPSLRLPSF